MRARLESARLIRAQVEALDPGTPVLLLGDFNAQAGGRVHRILTSGERGGRALVDLHADYPPGKEQSGTLSGFGRPPREWIGLRIDWILASEGLAPLEATIDRARYRGRYPSDHYPLRALLAYRDEPEESP